jgi:hypothetical protein
LNRSDAAFEFLFALVREGASDLAKEALEALDAIPLDESMRDRVDAARRAVDQ